MDRQELERLGNELRHLGHRRRELAEQIFSEVQDGDNQSSKKLYLELSDISEQAITLMTQQKEMFDNEVRQI
jgi:hypothetical protein